MVSKAEIKELDSLETKLNIDCTAFCPFSEDSNVLLVCKYQLDTETQKVNGGYLIYDCSNKKLDLKAETQEIGIFDAKWLKAKHQEKPIFAAAYASPSFQILSLNKDADCKHSFQGGCTFLYLDKVTTLSEDILSEKGKNLFIDHLFKDEKHYFLVTDDLSRVNYIEKDSNFNTITKKSFTCKHEFTIWCAQWLPDNQNCADDAKLNLHDLRCADDITTNQNKKAHQMGVCDINFDPKDPNLFITGSYDDTIRLWDIRKFQPMVEKNLGGGVWRARYDPYGKELIGCATMYNNFQLVKVDAAATFQCVQEYNAHKSLCYGIDFQYYNPEARVPVTLATCSFYDNKLCLWEFSS